MASQRANRLISLSMVPPLAGELDKSFLDIESSVEDLNSDISSSVSGLQGQIDAVAASVLPPATQPEAEAGVLNDKGMTPLRTLQAVRDQVPIVTLRWFADLVTNRPDPDDERTWDWAPAITALNDYVKERLNRFDKTTGDTFKFVEGEVNILLEGTFSFSNELIIWPGACYTLSSGSRLVALANGQTMVRSPTVSELSSLADVGPTYGSWLTRLIGGGIIDGADLASIGLLADTLATEGNIDVTITRCTYRRYSTTGSGTSSSAVVNLADASQVRPLDTVEIQGAPRRFYTVRSKSGNAITLNRNLDANLTNVEVTHRACGLSANGAQQSSFNIVAFYNDIGWLFGPNRDNIRITDMRMRGMAEFNMLGEVILLGDLRHHGPTIQHNFEQEIVVCDGIGAIWESPYIENMADAQANSLMPPIGSAPIGAPSLNSRPMIELIGGRSVFNNINYPTNPTSTSWRRFMRNAADAVVDGVTLASVALLVNPSIAGDYALIEQNASTGGVLMMGVRGATNLNVAGPVLICKSDGSAPNASQASWEYSASNNWAQVFANNRWITWLTSSLLDIYRRGESFPRLSVFPGSIQFGGGAAATDTTLNRGSVAGTLSVNDGSIAGFVGRRVSVPTTSAQAGKPGDFAVASDYFYFYTGDGTTHSWRRCAALTF